MICQGFQQRCPLTTNGIENAPTSNSSALVGLIPRRLPRCQGAEVLLCFAASRDPFPALEIMKSLVDKIRVIFSKVVVVVIVLAAIFGVVLGFIFVFLYEVVLHTQERQSTGRVLV